MLVSVVLERSEVASAEGSVDSVAGYGVGSGVVYGEDSKARVLVVISLKTYTQTTLALTNNRLVGYVWMALLALPPALPLSMAEEAMVVAVAVSTQNPVNK